MRDDLLKKVYALIKSKPDHGVNLNTIVHHMDRENPCGTIACAAGWIGLDPEFNALGVEIVGVMPYVLLSYKGYSSLLSVMSELLEITPTQAQWLFGSRSFGYEISGPSVIPNWHSMTHKELFLARMKAFFNDHGIQ